jgi:hypothetical protein
MFNNFVTSISDNVILWINITLLFLVSLSFLSDNLEFLLGSRLKQTLTNNRNFLIGIYNVFLMLNVYRDYVKKQMIKSI